MLFVETVIDLTNVLEEIDIFDSFYDPIYELHNFILSCQKLPSNLSNKYD